MDSFAHDYFPERRSDGERTHGELLEVAMRLASIEGLGSLTFGRLAEESGISKSGVFAHFRSKRVLQEATIQAAREAFRREVLEPGLNATEGLAQLEGVCEAFLSYVERAVFPGGCFFAQLLGEFDAQDGPIHDQVASDQRDWVALLSRLAELAQRRGEIADHVDPHQLAFELYAPMELANYLAVLHRDPQFIERARRTIGKTFAYAVQNTNNGG